MALPSYLYRPPRRTAVPGSQDPRCATSRRCATYSHAPAASSWPACPEQLQPWPARYLRVEGRGAPGPASRGDSLGGGRGGVLLREGATRLSGITARHHWSRGDAGGGVRGWRVTARDLEVRGTRRLPQRTQGLGVSRSPRRPPLGDSRMEIIQGCSWSPPGTQELRMSPPGNSGVILGIFTEDTGD